MSNADRPAPRPMSGAVKVFQIGPDGTEYYAAHSAEEMRDWYKANSGADDVEDDLREYFEELPEAEMDAEFKFDDDGEYRLTTWRKLALEGELPRQLSTGYN